MNPTAQNRLPRPNRGPEPWTPPGLGALKPWLIGLGFVLGLITLILVFWRSRTTKSQPILKPGFELWTNQLRTALAKAWGPDWLSKTTEEICLSPQLQTTLTADQASKLIEFFQESDRQRFGKPSAETHQNGNELWAAWIDSFVQELERAGTNSRMIGK